MRVGKIFISIVVVFALLGTLMVFQATRSSASSILLPSDLIKSVDVDHDRIRVAGRVAPSSVEYDVEPKIVLKFAILDPAKQDGGTVSVVYEGLKPDMFAAGRDVLIDGDFRNGKLLASQLLTQCPSKYEPPSPTDINSQGRQ